MNPSMRAILHVHALTFGKQMIDRALVADSLSPHDTKQLAEDLGIEHDTPEHVELERGQFCGASKRR